MKAARKYGGRIGAGLIGFGLVATLLGPAAGAAGAVGSAGAMGSAGAVDPAGAVGSTSAVGSAGAGTGASVRAGLPVTVEERRLDGDVPREILRRSGFDGVAPEFVRELTAAQTYAQVWDVVERRGEGLWRRAVDRAQGRGPAGGDLSRDDDRPLYWARLAMTREVRTVELSFRLSGSQRLALLDLVERTSRGQTDVRYPVRGAHEKAGGKAGGKPKKVRRILVTGFDPFTLDRDIRISNPSGASALALDGTTVRTKRGPARVETMVFPVRWDDFAVGAVERALRTQLPEVDLFTTLSQGRVGRFDVERTNGAWRGGSPDNVNATREGQVPVQDPASQPQWTTTTLPYERIVAARTGRFPVYDNTAVTEIPAGGTEPVERPDGPTPGSTARAGGGGDYLSNEIAYRATLLRDRLGLRDTLPGGHVHTPVLQFGPGNTDPASGTVTDPAFVRNRLDIVRQVRKILTTAANTATTGG